MDQNGSRPIRTLAELAEARFTRRSVLRNGGKILLAGSVFSTAGTLITACGDDEPGFSFQEIKAHVTEDHEVAPDHEANVVIRWGDPLFADAPRFDPDNQTPEAQERQFGFNNDYVAFMPLPLDNPGATRGLLVVNHEYTSPRMMFPSYTEATPDSVAIEMAAHGLTVVEVRNDNETGWRYIKNSPFNRRLSARSSFFQINGPAAGHDRMKTSADPRGKRVLGTFNNCAGGMTPWGTTLHAEENFHKYFEGDPDVTPEARNIHRYGVPQKLKEYQWNKFHRRFRLEEEPNEPNRFGWMVELDPYDPTATPKKRTALGRFKHEGAGVVINPDGRIVIYMGDDERFDYLYKFVTRRPYDSENRKANRDLLDEGILYVARFDADGGVRWLPLIFGQGPLTAAEDFHSQADVLIETRRAADLLGATPMDRPEDVEAHPTDGRVYVMLTNNSKRTKANTNPANPRARNHHGHIVELTVPDNNHAATIALWDILILAGDPNDPETNAKWHPDTTENGWFTDPDNCAIDGRGRLWVSTDGNTAASHSKRNDGLWAVETEGALRGLSRHFYRCPVGAEMCGVTFTPDDETLWLAVQHPGEAGVKKWKKFGRTPTFDDPPTRWPDFNENMPPRPSVVAVTRKSGGKVG